MRQKQAKRKYDNWTDLYKNMIVQNDKVIESSSTKEPINSGIESPMLVLRQVRRRTRWTNLRGRFSVAIMRISLLALSMLLAFSLAHGKEYGIYDPKRMLTVSETPSGKKYGFDVKYLDQMLNDLALHAMNYPPRFDTIQDRQRAIQDEKTLSGMLDILINGPNPNPELLWRAGFLNSMGYNLGIPGSAEKTSVIFKKLLAVAPADPKGNYMYGMFLAGAGKPKEALPYLKRALSVGVTDAAYALGMTYLSLGDKPKALENLEAYRKRRPSDGDISKLIDSIRNGKVEIKRSPN